jgi:hypothetical protein
MENFNKTTSPSMSDSDKNGNIEIKLHYLEFNALTGYHTRSEIRVIPWNNYRIEHQKAVKTPYCTFSGWRHTDKWLNDESNQVTIPDKISSSESNLFVLAKDNTLWSLSMTRINEGWVQLPNLPKQKREWQNNE